MAGKLSSIAQYKNFCEYKKSLYLNPVTASPPLTCTYDELIFVQSLRL